MDCAREDPNHWANAEQATEGDATGPRPGMLQLTKRAKYDAHASCAGMDKQEAQAAYVQLLCSLEPRFEPHAADTTPGTTHPSCGATVPHPPPHASRQCLSLATQVALAAALW